MTLIVLDKGRLLADSLATVEDNLNAPFITQKLVVTDCRKLALAVSGTVPLSSNELAQSLLDVITAAAMCGANAREMMVEYLKEHLEDACTLYIATKDKVWVGSLSTINGERWRDTLKNRGVDGVYVSGSGGKCYYTLRAYKPEATPKELMQLAARYTDSINDVITEVILDELEPI